MPTPPPTLLVVDDEEINRDLLGRRLARAGYNVELAANGEQAMAMLATRPIDLVLLDIMMPDVSGLDVLRRIRDTRTTPHLPVIMVTARAQPEDIVEALDLGADDYVTKPVQFAVALARIRSQISRLQSARALSDSEERYALAVQGTDDGVWDWHVESGETYFSARWRAIMQCGEGPTPAGMEFWLERVHPEDREHVRSDLATHVSGASSHLQSEFRVRHDDGYRWILSRARAVRGPDGRAARVVGSITDVTESKLVDPLTGLPNRVLFNDRLARLFEHAKRVPGYQFGVLCLDLDRFKKVNDGLGHAAGDRLLVETARRLEQNLRATDSVTRLDQADVSSGRSSGHTIARFGGDEFTVILGGLRGPSDATRVADRLMRAVAEAFQIDGQEVFLTASVGIALSASGYGSPANMLRDADTALYRAKAAGRARSELFDTAMHEEVVRRLQMETDLRRALPRGELLLHYQPIVKLGSGELAGVEALLRWQHPTYGLVLPTEFIPLAEDSGLIVPIGYWVIEEACRQIEAWARDEGGGALPVVSVNMSRRQLHEPDLVERAMAIVDRYGIPHRLLEFELTEHVVVTDLETLRSAVERLKAAGFRISIDDFGTGYSSLSCLQHLPVDRLKLDRSFLDEPSLETGAQSVLGGIMLLAEHMKLEVVAEGIETEAHLKRVRGLHCPLGQGYFLSRPQPPGRRAPGLGGED